MADQSKLERVLRILQRMMTHQGVSVRELYNLFDGRESMRSLQRDLNSIQNANIPLVVTRGSHGERYYSLHRAFDFIPINLSSDEVLAAILLSQFAEYFEGTPIGVDIYRVLKKVDQLVPPGCVAVSSTFREISQNFLHHEPGRASLRPRGHVLRDLFRAILTRCVCHVYYGPSGKSYDVHPYSLVLHNGLIYAVVYHPQHGDWIYLALPRISRLVLQEEAFQRDPNFHLCDFMRGKFGLWSEEPEHVRIRFDRVVVPSIADRIWHPSQKLETASNGDVLLSLNVGLSSELLAWVLRWANFAEVLEPLRLRQQVEEALQMTLNRYRQSVSA